MSPTASPQHDEASPPGDDPQTGPSDAGRKRRKVTRSRAGCLTCRKRRKLCTMEKPHCGACERLRMECVWPAMRSLDLEKTPTSSNRRLSSSAFSDISNTSPLSTSNNNDEHRNHIFPPLSDNAFFVPPTLPNDMSRLSGSGTGPPSNPLISLPNPTDRQSAIDGLMNLVSSDTNHYPPLDPFDNGHDPFPAFQNPLPPPLPPQAPPMSNQSLSMTNPPNLQLQHPPDNSLFTSDLFSFDDATLQLWAANCLPSLTGPAQNPFDSLNDLLFQSNSSASSISIPQPVPELDATPSSSSPLSNSESHQAMLVHYQESLSSLVSCAGESAPNAFDAFTTLANAALNNQVGQGLHLSILAWAGRHMVNQGQHKYEAVSERLGSQAAQIILDKLGRHAELTRMEEKELMTLFAGVLMLVQFKICRGDVWGFDAYVDHLLRLTPLLFPANNPNIDPNSTHFHFFENLVYHYTVSSSILTRGPLMSDAVLAAYARPALDVLHTLTGVSFKTFCIMHEIAGLIRQKRAQVDGAWHDDHMADFVKMAERIEEELEEERIRLDSLVKAKPHFSSHRYFHEAFRIACLLQLRSFVYGIPPSSLNIRFLVRRSLSLLEAMAEKNLPGFCSAHWVIFTTAVCAAPGGQAAGEPDDRARVDKLYEKTISSLAFLNTSRSRKIVLDVWGKNQNGNLLVDWLDVLAEYDWEIMFA